MMIEHRETDLSVRRYCCS